MISVKRLKELLAKVPDDAKVWAYEGEDIGIGIASADGKQAWWIQAWGAEEDNIFTEGFDV